MLIKTKIFMLLIVSLLTSGCITEAGKIKVNIISSGTTDMAPASVLLSYEKLGAYLAGTGAFTTGITPTGGQSDGVFQGPYNLAVDSTNNFLYVVDASNYRIQKFTSAGVHVGSIGYALMGGTCTTGVQAGWCKGGYFLPGYGNGGFKKPWSVKLDVAGDLLYVADEFSIQKFQLSTGAFIAAIGNSTASGTCTSGSQASWCTGGVFTAGASDGMFDRAIHLELNVLDNFFLVADYNNHRVQKFNLTTGAFIGAIGKSTASGTCIAGAQTAWCTGGVFSAGASDGQFDYPISLTLHRTTNILVVVNHNSATVQKFNLTTGAHDGTIGVASGAAGTCVAGKQNAWCVGGTYSWSSSNGGFWGPNGVVFDSGNNLMYISDSSNKRIQKFTLSTGAWVGQIGKAFSANGNCVSGPQAGWCTGSVTFVGGDENGSISAASGGLGIDTVNNFLYHADSANRRIQRYVLSTGAPSSFLTGVMAPALSGWTSFAATGTGAASTATNSFASTSSMVIDKDNNLMYVSSTYFIQKFNLTTGVFLGAIGNSTAAGTCIAGKQNGWCVGGTFSSGQTDGLFNTVPHLAADFGRNILYAASGNRIQKFVLSTGAFVGAVGNSTASGTCTAGAQATWCTGGVFSDGTTDGRFTNLTDIALDADNELLYVTDSNNGRVIKLNSSTGAFIGAIGNSTASGTCVAGAQSAWCTGGVFSSVAGDGTFSYVNSIALDLTNDYFYVADYHVVHKFDLTTGSFVGKIGNSTASGTCVAGAQSSWCTGGSFTFGYGDGMYSFGTKVEVDAENNNLYVANDNKIEKMNLSTGQFIGAIGYSFTVSGTCQQGHQSDWCTGGDFTIGSGDGMFSSVSDIKYVDSILYVADQYRLQRIIEN